MSLDSEIEKQWKRLSSQIESGKIESIKKQLDFDCHDLDSVYECSKVVKEANGLIENYSTLPSSKRYKIAKIGLRQFKQNVEEVSTNLENCLERIVFRSYDESTSIQKAKNLNQISKNIESPRLVSRTSELLRKIEEYEDRFYDKEFISEYDREYRRIKRKLNNIDKKEKNNLKIIRELAMDSHQLTENYKSVGDEEGASRAALLHDEVEGVAQKLVPVYDSWKNKKYTIGFVLAATIFGFFKGDYIKMQARSLLNNWPQVKESTISYIKYNAERLEGKSDRFNNAVFGSDNMLEGVYKSITGAEEIDAYRLSPFKIENINVKYENGVEGYYILQNSNFNRERSGGILETKDGNIHFETDSLNEFYDIVEDGNLLLHIK